MSDISNYLGTDSGKAMSKQHSQASVTIFILTFLYMTFISDISSGVLGGALFFFIGIFMVPLAIALPAVMLKLLFVIKATKNQSLAKVVSGLIDFSYLISTVWITRYVYMNLFS